MRQVPPLRSPSTMMVLSRLASPNRARILRVLLDYEHDMNDVPSIPPHMVVAGCSSTLSMLNHGCAIQIIDDPMIEGG